MRIVIRNLFVKLGWVVPLLTWSCAAPAPNTSRQQFVPEADITLAHIVDEGVGFYRQGRFIDAELRFRQALYMVPGTANIRRNLARALVGSGQNEEGIAILKELAAKNTKDLSLQLDLARSLFRAKRYEEGLSLTRTVAQTALDQGNFDVAASAARNEAEGLMNIGEEEAALCRAQEVLSLRQTSDDIQWLQAIKASMAPPSPANVDGKG